MTREANPPVLDQPTGRLLQLLAHPLPRRRVIGLAGLPGSGKSTLARQLADAVNAQADPGSMLALGMDGFHLTRAALSAFADPTAALARRGAPWTFDPVALADALRTLQEVLPDGSFRPVPWPGFEHGVGDPVPAAITVAPTVRLVLVEGLYLLHRRDGWALDGLLDECWFLDVAPETAMVRLTARHQASWGLTHDQAQERIASNDRFNADTVLQGRARADWLVTPTS